MRDIRGQEIGQDFLTSVGFGKVPGYRRISALGNMPGILNADLPAEVWPVGTRYNYLTEATQLEVTASAADSPTGVGARVLLISGLNQNWREINEVVFLNGVTPVPTVQSFIRVNSAIIRGAGTKKTNAGNINIRPLGGGPVKARIPAGVGITRQAIFSVPAGFTLNVYSLVCTIHDSVSLAREATFETFVQSSTGFFILPYELPVQNGVPFTISSTPGLVIIPERTDFSLRVKTQSTDATNVSAAFLAVLSDNSIT